MSYTYLIIAFKTSGSVRPERVKSCPTPCQLDEDDDDSGGGGDDVVVVVVVVVDDDENDYIIESVWIIRQNLTKIITVING